MEPSGALETARREPACEIQREKCAAGGKQEGELEAGHPPALPYRSFKTTLSCFKRQNVSHDRLDRSAFSSKLFNTNLRETIEAYRFLGLIDGESAPSATFKDLVRAVGEDAWPSALRGTLERSYHRLLAREPGSMTGGLLRAFRSTYETGAENGRKRCTFFLQACRDAGLANNARMPPDLRSMSGKAMRTGTAGVLNIRTQERATAKMGSGHARDLLQKLPAYDAAWSDEVKRLWLVAFHDLVLRLHT